MDLGQEALKKPSDEAAFEEWDKANPPTVPYNLIVDLTMDGGPHGTVDRYRHDSLTEVIKHIRREAFRTIDTHARAEEREESFVAGLRAGITAFAHWHDGQQWVGTCGKSLADAMKGVDERTGYLGDLIAAARKRASTRSSTRRTKPRRNP